MGGGRCEYIQCGINSPSPISPDTLDLLHYHHTPCALCFSMPIESEALSRYGETGFVQKDMDLHNLDVIVHFCIVPHWDIGVSTRRGHHEHPTQSEKDLRVLEANTETVFVRCIVSWRCSNVDLVVSGSRPRS